MLTELELALQAHRSSQGFTTPFSARAVPSQTSLDRSAHAPPPLSTESPVAHAASPRLPQPPHLPRLLSRPHPGACAAAAAAIPASMAAASARPYLSCCCLGQLLLSARCLSYLCTHIRPRPGIINCPCSLFLTMVSLMAILMSQAMSPDLKPHIMPCPIRPYPHRPACLSYPHPG